MKKFIKIISICLLLVMAMVMFSACSDAGAPEHKVDPKYAIEASELAKELDDFIANAKDRTSYTKAEGNAALYLQARLVDYGYSDAELQDFTTTENEIEDLQSQNVVARYSSKAGEGQRKNVVLGAYYDNRYGTAYNGAVTVKSEGALANGTGVATLLGVAKYLQSHKPQLDFDVIIVFFGASYVADTGAREFYKNGMSHEDRVNTVLMVEFQRLGGDHLYAFSDARETKREPFFDGVAKDNGLNVYKPTQKSPLITNAFIYDGIPYYQWAQSGLFGVFFDANIPTLNLIGANWETICMKDIESSNNGNISLTENDNLATLKKTYPDYAAKMATAATLVIRSMEAEKFLSVMTYDRDNFPSTDILTKSWIWYIIVIGALAVAAIALIAISSHLAKKYPISAPKPTRMKMAVFGMDYEDKSSGDIFIDIKDVSSGDDIFPGIPNNEKSADPFDEIFPALFGGAFVDSERNNSNDKATEGGDVFGEEHRANESEIDDGAERMKKESDGDKPETDGAAQEPQKEQSAPKNKKPPQKRKTTSAGKSVSAGKSNTTKKTNSGKSAAKADKPESDGKSDKE
ncbi:MAG: M28 family peptidase [Clostridiales bacterium]|nr:M28 family peptidase [Clostridiales bacterium]